MAKRVKATSLSVWKERQAAIERVMRAKSCKSIVEEFAEANAQDLVLKVCFEAGTSRTPTYKSGPNKGRPTMRAARARFQKCLRHV